MEELIIRRAVPEDAQTLLAFSRQIGAESDNLSFGPEGLPLTLEQERAYLEARAREPRAVLYTAWLGDRLVGNASLRALTRRAAHRGEVSVAVSRAHWNAGIGSRLMAALIDFARDIGLELLSLEVRQDNAAAIHLYEKFGFQTTGTFPAYFKIGEEYADFLQMCLDLR